MGQYSRWITAGLTIGLFTISDVNWVVAASQTREPIASDQEDEEALLVRRILALLKDQEHVQVKKQILQFLKQYPESRYRDSLLVILGDTYQNEGHYEHALAIYQRIQSPQLQQRVYNNYVEAENTLNQGLKTYSDLDKREADLFERNTLLYRQGRWMECRKAARQFAAKYPHSSRTPTMLQYIPSATLKRLEEAEANGQETHALTEQLVKDIQLVLQVPNAIPEDQRPKYLFKLGRSLWELQRYPEALAVADELIQKHPNDPNLYQAHLLAALCYRDGLQETPSLTYHVEKALELNPELKKNWKIPLSGSHTRS